MEIFIRIPEKELIYLLIPRSQFTSKCSQLEIKIDGKFLGLKITINT